MRTLATTVGAMAFFFAITTTAHTQTAAAPPRPDSAAVAQCGQEIRKISSFALKLQELRRTASMEAVLGDWRVDPQKGEIFFRLLDADLRLVLAESTLQWKQGKEFTGSFHFGANARFIRIDFARYTVTTSKGGKSVSAALYASADAEKACGSVTLTLKGR